MSFAEKINKVYKKKLSTYLKRIQREMERADTVERPEGEDILIDKMKRIQGIKE